MKKTIRILIPLLLILAIIGCSVWYLFVYDREFTRDVLLSCARFSERQGNHDIATWFYNKAYHQAGENDAVAIELAQQYIRSGNYTKAEYTLTNAINDGGGIDLYIALCDTYVQQNKLLDAVKMLDNVTDKQIKAELDKLRPAAPVTAPEAGFYNQYISVSVTAKTGKLYVSADGEYPSKKTDVYASSISMKDGENTIYALSVADNGLVSPLCIASYTIGGIIEKVEFNDAPLEHSIRELIGKSEGTDVYSNELWTITQFAVPAEAKQYDVLQYMAFVEELTIENGVSEELDCISKLSNLTKLQISGTPVTQEQLQFIAAFPKLKTLILQNCGLTSIAPLENAKLLTYLDLSENTFRAISALSSLSTLEELYLQNNVIDDLSSIANLTHLKKLNVSHNALTTLAPISKLTSLKEVYASYNALTDLGNLGALTALTHLSVASNQLTDVTSIAQCLTLIDLNISENKLTDISPLSALVQMMYFDFSHNEVTSLPTWPKNCALVRINGSHNKLSSLDALGGLEYLNNVDMDYNENISSVEALASCHVLIEVNVYATKVKNVTSLTNQSIIVNYKPVS